MGIFDGVSTATPRFDALYFKPGLYVPRIDGVASKKNRKEEPMIAINTTIMQVLNNAEGRSLKVGDQPSQVMKRSSDYFLSDWKAFAMALSGLEKEEIDEWASDLMIEKGMFTGYHLLLECRERPIQGKQGQVFTTHRWIGVVTPERAVEYGVDPSLIQGLDNYRAWGQFIRTNRVEQARLKKEAEEKARQSAFSSAPAFGGPMASPPLGAGGPPPGPAAASGFGAPPPRM